MSCSERSPSTISSGPAVDPASRMSAYRRMPSTKGTIESSNHGTPGRLAFFSNAHRQYAVIAMPDAIERT